jgi:competence protein ComEC
MTRGVTEGRCQVLVRFLAVARAEGGSRVTVEGEFARSTGALSARRAHVVRVEPPGWLARARNRTGASIDRVYGTDGPMARALVIADQHDIARDVRDRFADAGIIHMVSVSGLHVSIIAGSLVAMLSAVGASRRRADVVALVLLGAYIVFIGAPPPAVRSAGMLGLTVLARLAQRPTSPWAIWAVGSGISLGEPRTALDLGWQLSVSGMAGLLASGVFMARLSLELAGWRRTVLDNVVATAIASAVTGPISAWVFERISVAALVTNILAAPLFNIAQPLLFASVALLPLSALGGFVADAARSALWLIDLVARAGAALPGAVLPMEPTAATALLMAVAAAGVVTACASRAPRRGIAVALGAVVAAIWWPALQPGSGRLELHALDVGQGDAIALRSPKGRWLVVDAGGAWTRGDAALSVVRPHLRRRGGRITYLAMTHPHADHIGGVRTLLDREPVDTLWDTGFVGNSATYLAALQAARVRHVAWKRAVAGDSVDFDGVVFRVLAPDESWLAAQENPNEASLVLMAEYRGVRFLLTGDAEHAEEAWLVERYGAGLAADVLKVGHHGSATSSTPAFLAAVAPKIALVSVGAGNDYGHPSQDVLHALDAAGARVLRTDHDGTIMLATDGRTIDVTTAESRWRLSLAR